MLVPTDSVLGRGLPRQELVLRHTAFDDVCAKRAHDHTCGRCSESFSYRHGSRSSWFTYK